MHALNRSIQQLARATSTTLLLLGCGGTPAATHTDTPLSAEASTNAPTTDALADFRQPRANLWTGGVPTQDQLEAFAQRGGRVVISLVSDTEAEAAQVQALGMTFVSIPINGPADLTEANARTLGDVFAAHHGAPTLLHCASGNRAGALLALQAHYVEGLAADDAIALGKAAGLASLEPNVREIFLHPPSTVPSGH